MRAWGQRGAREVMGVGTRWRGDRGHEVEDMGTQPVWAWGQCGNRDGVGIGGMGTRGCGPGEGAGTRWWHGVVWRSRAWGQVWGQGWHGYGASEETGMTGALGWHGDIVGRGALWPGGQEQHGKSLASAGCWHESLRGHQGHIVPNATPPHHHHHHLGTGCGGAGASLGTKLPLWAPAVGTGSREVGGGVVAASPSDDDKCPRTTMASLAPVARKMFWGSEGMPSRRWMNRATSPRTSSMPGLAL